MYEHIIIKTIQDKKKLKLMGFSEKGLLKCCFRTEI